jgi:hypothetical protein
VIVVVGGAAVAAVAAVAVNRHDRRTKRMTKKRRRESREMKSVVDTVAAAEGRMAPLWRDIYLADGAAAGQDRTTMR